jgi:hypothetical protein
MYDYTITFALREKRCEMDFRCCESPDPRGFAEYVIKKIAEDIVGAINGATFLYCEPKENSL